MLTTICYDVMVEMFYVIGYFWL